MVSLICLRVTWYTFDFLSKAWTLIVLNFRLFQLETLLVADSFIKGADKIKIIFSSRRFLQKTNKRIQFYSYS